MAEVIRRAIDRANLPAGFPTHRHPASFWESLGRTVAAFGFLEETLGKAIFAFTATRRYSEAEIGEAYGKWLPKLQGALSDQLGGLIDTYGKAVREHPDAAISNLNELLEATRAASKIRNVLCHGSWRSPDQNGASVPLFVNKQGELFETPINEAWLEQTRQHVVDLTCAVIDTVTQIGWRFPGSDGPGIPISEMSQLTDERRTP